MDQQIQQSNCLYGIGIGPGDPDLITIGALKLLKNLSTILGPTLDINQAGRAETIVTQVVPDIKINRVVFPMSKDKNIHNSYLQAAEFIAPILDKESVGFITLGDPNIYSTFSTLAKVIQSMKPQISIKTIPGITAFQSLSSLSQTILTQDNQSLSLISGLTNIQEIQLHLSQVENTVVIYKAGKNFSKIVQLLKTYNRYEDALLGELLGMVEEHISKLKDYPKNDVSYLSTIIVPSKVSTHKGNL